MSRSRNLVILSCVLALALGTLGASAAPVLAEEPSTHVVRWGETLSSIATKYHVSVQALVQANDLRSANVIYAGQRLTIPQEAADSVTVHVVGPGESLISIARRYGVTIWEIAERNSIRNVNLVYIGQSLVIPVAGEPGATPAPTPSATPSRLSAAAIATPSPTARPASPVTPPGAIEVQEAIVLTTPVEGAAVGSPIAVGGWASAAENTVSIDVLDESGILVGQGFAIVATEPGQYGPFQGSVEFRGVTKAQTGRVQVYTVSPRDGAIVHLASVSVELGP